MTVEIEAKLMLPVRLAPRLRQFAPLRDLPFRRQWMQNLYLDTPDLALWKERIGVRRRQITTDAGKQWLLTVKNQGVTENGVSRRSEWEFPMPPAQLDFSGVEDTALRAWLSELAPQLQPVFCVSFVRQCWELSEDRLEENRVELALDFGYIRAGGAREALCEVELELLQGDDVVIAWWRDLLCFDLPELRPQPMSKAGRGYALLIHDF